MSKYKSYRRSDLEWLDEIPKHWELHRNKYLFEEVSEKSESGAETLFSLTKEKGLVDRAEITDREAMAKSLKGYKVCRPGDLVMNRMQAWNGMFGFTDKVGLVSPDYSVYRPAEHVDSRYYEYLFGTPLYIDAFQRRSKGVGSGFLRLYTPDFHDICSIVPPRSEQEAIADYLDSKTDQIDEYIAKKQELIELLETQRRAVINRAVTRGLDDGVKMTDSGVEWLDEIPAHWDTVQLRHVWDIIDCKHRTASYVDEGIPIVNPSEVEPDGLDLEGAKRTTEEEFKDLTTGGRRPQKGDIVYSRNASVGAAAYVDTDRRFCMGQDVCLIRSENQNQQFLAYQLNSSVVLNQLEVMMVGATFQRINVSAIGRLRVALPPAEEQDQIANYLSERMDEIDVAIENVETQIELMEQYRTSLVTEVVTGQVDVRDKVKA